MKFSLGQVVATRGALSLMEERGINPLLLLARHARGDWGDLDDEDKRANDQALVDGTRLFSACAFGDARLWVITEWDRSVTTILLPDEY